MQTSINKFGQPIAVAGQRSDNMVGRDVLSRFNAEASAVIPFGVAVKANSTYRDGVVNLSTSADVVEGVNLFGMNHQVGGDTTSGDLSQASGGLWPKAGLKLQTRGRMYVVVDAAVVTIQPNVDRAYVRYSSHAGVGLILGAFTNATDAGYTIDVTNSTIFRSGVFLSADGSTKIAELDFDFINK